MPRQGKNIQKIEARYQSPRYPNRGNGKGISTCESVHRNPHQEFKTKHIREIKRCQKTATPNCYLFKDLAYMWLDDSQIRLKDATVYRYSYLLETHILPELGSMKVDRITGSVINQFVKNKALRGRLDGKGGLSPAYVRSIILVVSAVIRFAADGGICDPIRIQPQKPIARPQELKVLSKEYQIQLEEFLIRDIDETKLGVYISLYTGLRIGEICALTWGDIDLQQQLLYVRHTVARVKTGHSNDKRTTHVIDSPKTKSSFRCIPICSPLLHILTSYGPKADSKYVVSNNTNFLLPRTYEYRYRRLLKASGIPHINYHALRHTFATRCIESGVDVKSLCEMARRWISPR